MSPSPSVLDENAMLGLASCPRRRPIARPPKVPANPSCAMTREYLTLQSLNDDCLLHILKFVGGTKLVSLARLSRQFRALVNHPDLWRHIRVSGSVPVAIAFMNHALLPRASAIRSLSFEKITFVSYTLIPGYEIENTFHTMFYQAVEGLLQKCGSQLNELVVAENGDTVFADSHFFFSSFAQHSHSLRKISLLSTKNSAYVDDGTLMLLTSSCGGVQHYRDLQGDGPSIKTMSLILDGWPSLESLEVNTNTRHCQEFAAHVAQFSDRLHHLRISHFDDSLMYNEGGWRYSSIRQSMNSTRATELLAYPLGPTGLEAVCIGLSNLISLESLTIDLRTTKHADGLYVDHIESLLLAAPRIKSFTYMVSYSTYYKSDGSLGRADFDPRSLRKTPDSTWVTNQYQNRIVTGCPSHRRGGALALVRILDRIRVAVECRGIKAVLSWSV
ncbi:uncharacterized protein BJ171DRAFT_117267 [Polychytrium aggregatum]|uniref:uncharacterized protein n=1 Tax=Polychytrium aggregatum TaxID=110093 RepID=UPI0022FE2767|nr:uncharacterized protein BJ171DRAFT_117267 [Polychytrium aggregatum]KAI9209413.1 hypothetical protein BJ171DRAFT_117267 [Polychytrium aggregatum]